MSEDPRLDAVKAAWATRWNNHPAEQFLTMLDAALAHMPKPSTAAELQRETSRSFVAEKFAAPQDPPASGSMRGPDDLRSDKTANGNLGGYDLREPAQPVEADPPPADFNMLWVNEIIDELNRLNFVGGEARSEKQKLIARALNRAARQPREVTPEMLAELKRVLKLPYGAVTDDDLLRALEAAERAR